MWWEHETGTSNSIVRQEAGQFTEGRLATWMAGGGQLHPARLTTLGLLMVMVFGCVTATSRQTETSLHFFERKPTLSSWEAFENDARLNKYGAVFAAIAEYYDAVQQRELPNSMVREGDPHDHVEISQRRAHVALITIRNGQDGAAWQLIERMALQTADDVLSFAGLELAARLSRERFERLSQAVAAQLPANQRFVELVRERWVDKK
jgi:hypothetical protein